MELTKWAISCWNKPPPPPIIVPLLTPIFLLKYLLKVATTAGAIVSSGNRLLQFLITAVTAAGNTTESEPCSQFLLKSEIVVKFHAIACASGKSYGLHPNIAPPCHVLLSHDVRPLQQSIYRLLLGSLFPWLVWFYSLDTSSQTAGSR